MAYRGDGLNDIYDENLTVRKKLSTGSFEMPTGAGAAKVLTSDAAGTGTWQAAAAGSGAPTGSITAWLGIAGTDATPTGWLLCDGTSYLQADYADLYALIGDKFGGDATHFNVPDTESMYLKCITYANPNSVGGMAGAETHQHAGISAGTPAGTINAHGNAILPAGLPSPNTAFNSPVTHAFTGSALASHQHAVADHNPPYMLVVWIIKT